MLDGKIVAITGGVGLLGAIFSKSVVAHGGKVLIGDISESSGKKLSSELGNANAIYFNGDLTDVKEIKKFISCGVDSYGKIDAAIHCAYPVSDQWGTRFEDLQPDGLKMDLFSQLGGAILVSQQMINQFRKQKYGNLIHISSIQGVSAPKFDHYIGTDMVSPIEYTAIKAGVIAMVGYLAKYTKGENIRVNCVSPGGIKTDQPDSFVEKYRSDCSSKGMLDSEDITGALTFLLSDYSNYVNGQNIVVDDGWSL
jgi:NAD(P)-dependent dehydrogenase (short-subunit alcohol dehydrogenase family)